ncbi:hypothetical protein MsAm2_14420 [Methanolapillus ohkumae]|uniref:UPF0201 protein MsAm2_14420 n=1 Tax=Methanolapillus ohkumae TaxID=3028298 RepID=A0AA96V6M0_9EURY|nr:hypothetical protein MsAm2_14420 [Methanosarcinaceae archaeon Am2]
MSSQLSSQLSSRSSQNSPFDISFSAFVFPTENPEKVMRSILNLVNYGRPKTEVPVLENTIVCTPATADGILVQKLSLFGGLDLLFGIHYLVRREEIIDTMRSELEHGILEESDSGDEISKTVIFLNKQVAYVKRLNFPADAEPLGSVELEIQADSPARLAKVIEWLAPPTKEGVALYELKVEDLF